MGAPLSVDEYISLGIGRFALVPSAMVPSTALFAVPIWNVSR